MRRKLPLILSWAFRVILMIRTGSHSQTACFTSICRWVLNFDSAADRTTQSRA
jgi:hypothetical protein